MSNIKMTFRNIDIYQRNVELYLNSIEPYLIAISKINDLYFKGYIIKKNDSSCETIYKDGYEEAIKPYHNAIDSIRELIFGKDATVLF